MSKSTSIKTRPVVYFPSLTNEELISYADSYGETLLEGELLVRVKCLLEECDDLRKEAKEAYDDGYTDGKRVREDDHNKGV